MHAFLGRILYGTAHADTRLVDPAVRQTRVFWLLAVVVLFGLRLALPFHLSESQAAYDAVTWALLAEQNWGKQALAGIIEYSPLPAVCQLVASPLQAVRFLPPPNRLVIAGAQVWVLCLVIRTTRIYFPRLVGAVVGILLFALVLLTPGADGLFSGYWFVADPFWVCAVPLAAAICHVARWERDGRLRDLIIAAIAAGILVFGGLAGMLFAANITLVLVLRGRRHRDEPPVPALLVLMPLLYAALLFFLFNHLVMGDVFFAFRRLGEFFQAAQFWTSAARGARLVWLGLAVCLPLVALLIRPISLTARLSWHLAAASALCHLMQHGGRIFIGGAFVLATVGLLPILLQIASVPTSPQPLRRCLPAAVGLLLGCGMLVFRKDALDLEDFSDPGAPSRREIVALVDSRWQDSRILVYGLRPAVLYSRPDNNRELPGRRFVCRLDFNPYVLHEHMEHEQLHLLVPPDSGRYYPQHHRIFSEVHGEGVPDWLLLEAVWPSRRDRHGGQWQLWRCIRRQSTMQDSPRP